MGLEIPGDISVAGFDDIFMAAQLSPRLVTVYQNTREIGRRAAEKLISLIERENVSIEPDFVNTELRVGDSVSQLL